MKTTRNTNRNTGKPNTETLRSIAAAALELGHTVETGALYVNIATEGGTRVFVTNLASDGHAFEVVAVVARGGSRRFACDAADAEIAALGALAILP